MDRVSLNDFNDEYLLGEEICNRCEAESNSETPGKMPKEFLKIYDELRNDGVESEAESYNEFVLMSLYHAVYILTIKHVAKMLNIQWRALDGGLMNIDYGDMDLSGLNPFESLRAILDQWEIDKDALDDSPEPSNG